MIEENEYISQNQLLHQYMQKYFSPPKIKQLVEEFSFAELRKLLGEMDIDIIMKYDIKFIVSRTPYKVIAYDLSINGFITITA